MCVSLSASSFTLIIQVYSWGLGDSGRLGHGDEQDCTTPKLIKHLQSIKVCGIAAGAMHSLAVTETELYGWGFGWDSTLELQSLTEHRLLPEKYNMRL